LDFVSFLSEQHLMCTDH